MKTSRALLLFSILLAFAGCAKRGTPDGGPEDIVPPKYVRATPENFTTNFDEDEIRIYFDEYIKLNDAQRQIIISPPMDPRPEITPLGTASKSVRIRINDTLESNTTYAINFGQSIVDNNADNPLPFFQYIFSTGSYIDSLAVRGSVADAYLRETSPFISVMLYEVDSTYNDSIVYNKPPRYVTNTLDSLTTFQLNYLKEGTYRLIALNDLNNNYRFDPQNEKIAFLKKNITVPTDSFYKLRLFKEPQKISFTRPKQVAQQHLIFGYTGIIHPDSLKLTIHPTAEEFEYRIVKDRKTDTLHYWYKPLLERDTLQFIVEAPDYQDSLLTRITKMEKDSLQITFEPSGTVNFDETVKILPNIPISTTDESLITLMDKDTLPVPFTLEYEEFSNRILLNFEKVESGRYNFQALPGAFTDFFGNVNDTIRSGFKSLTFSDYGNVVVNLQNVRNFPILVQLTNDAGEVITEQSSNNITSFTFNHLRPATYYIRIIYDANHNGQWDTGSFLENRQPEDVYYFADPVEVRANWDWTQEVDLEDLDPTPEEELPEEELIIQE